MAPKRSKSKKTRHASEGKMKPKVRTVTRQSGLSTTRTTTSMYRVKIEHEELIGVYNALSGVDNQLILFELDPSNPQTFPWLSNISKNFLYYRANRLMFRWKSTAIVTTPGSVTLGIQYDPLAPAPEHPEDVGILGGMVTDHVFNSIDCAAIASSLNTIPFHYLTSDGDARLQSMGRAALSLETGPGTAALGKLWVRYSFEFWAPQFIQHDLQSLFSGTGEATTGGSAGIFPTVSGSSTGTVVAASGDSAISCTAAPGGWPMITVPNDGKYAVTVQTPFLTESTVGSLDNLVVYDPHGVVRSVNATDISSLANAAFDHPAMYAGSVIVDIAKDVINALTPNLRTFGLHLVTNLARVAAAAAVGYVNVRRVPDRVTYRVDEVDRERAYVHISDHWIPAKESKNADLLLESYRLSCRADVVAESVSARVASASIGMSTPVTAPRNSVGAARR